MSLLFVRDNQTGLVESKMADLNQQDIFNNSNLVSLKNISDLNLW